MIIDFIFKMIKMIHSNGNFEDAPSRNTILNEEIYGISIIFRRRIQFWIEILKLLKSSIRERNF